MKFSLFFILIISSISTYAQSELPGIELFSPQTNLSLKLYHDSFELSSLSFSYDVIRDRSLFKGKYRLLKDTLFLFAGQDKVFRLKKVTFEIYEPINLDTLNSSQRFLAWTIRYSNGQTKQTGGWTKQNAKQGVWQYFDSTGILINKKLFREGELLIDNFKFSWEQ